MCKIQSQILSHILDTSSILFHLGGGGGEKKKKKSVASQEKFNLIFLVKTNQ